MSQFSGSSYGRYSRIWLIITGVILLAVGGGMALVLGTIPFAGGAMLGTGGILAIVGIGLIVVGLVVGRRAAATDQLLTSGIPGQASITGLTQTGMYFNENPQVRMQLIVSLPGQQPYAAQHTEIVPLILLGRLSSGAPLSVRVDPADFNRIAVDWSSTGFAPGVPMGGMPMAQAQPMAYGQPWPRHSRCPEADGRRTGRSPPPGSPPASGMDESLSQVQAAMAGTGTAAAAPFATADQGNYTVEQLRAYLRQSGLQASARVDRLEDMGKIVGDERLYTMEMTLNIPGQAPQKLPASAAMVPVRSSHKLFQGMNVPVRYEATNPNLLMVEWDKI